MKGDSVVRGNGIVYHNEITVQYCDGTVNCYGSVAHWDKTIGYCDRR